MPKPRAPQPANVEPLAPPSKMFYELDASAVEAFVKKATGQEYSVAADEQMYDCCRKFTVDGKVDDYDAGRVESFLAGNVEGNLLGCLLNHLAKQGLLPLGDYIVEAVD